ncbi:plasminogen activator, urokinase a [Denticeps clupeoides]|uniref:trypsin n=1 Tax=Denticeps clupeoides TaxID=299321 RepID=A0AAY4AZG7_9TELE|nr:urokinase-type plasminogen activator [Denticeps clupeoides]XP_028825805.1 urokinase-type plasminogen activator [Denticeps clupeoides]
MWYKINFMFVVTLIVAHIIKSETVWFRRWPRKVHLTSEECLRGDGIDYRGTMSKTARGRKCINWADADMLWQTGMVEKHNYCRNPNGSHRPWCWVRRGIYGIKREFCEIPTCSSFNPTPRPQQSTDTDRTCGERMRTQKEFKVVGGSLTTVEIQPWITSIFYRGHFRCGGTLISPCWVLTAAHCFTDINKRNIVRLSVYLGKNAINETDWSREQEFHVKNLILHEDYIETGRDFNNDIALINIAGKGGQCVARTQFSRTVCLPPAQSTLPSGFPCYIAGYGRDHTGTYSQFLKEGQVLLLPDKKCKEAQPDGSSFTKNMMCAASLNWKTDACQGDSGGPLVCEVQDRIFIFGIISFGEACAEENKPGYYTRVSNYNKWIADKTGLPSYTLGSMYPQK